MPVVIFSVISRFWKKLLFSDSLLEPNKKPLTHACLSYIMPLFNFWVHTQFASAAINGDCALNKFFPARKTKLWNFYGGSGWIKLHSYSKGEQT
jgi:hypothetical protein